MTWLVHLAAYPVHQVHILGEPAQVAASSLSRRIHFYHLADGAEQASLEVDPDLLDSDSDDLREAGLATLQASNGAYLPFVSFGNSHLYLSPDGRRRLIHDLNAGLTIEKILPGQKAEIFPLDLGKKGKARYAAWDRAGSLVAAITKSGQLHIFENEAPLRQWAADYALPLKLFVLGEPGGVLLLNSQGLHLLDLEGVKIAHRALHYEAGAIAISPDGAHILIGDSDSQVLRLYDRALAPLRQRYALDFIVEAQQVQLFAALPSAYAPISALAVDAAGNLAFALAGVVCTGHIDSMHHLPSTRPAP